MENERAQEDTFRAEFARTVCDKLAADPLRVLQIARRNLAAVKKRNPSSEYDEWERIIDAGPEAVRDVLLDHSERGRKLRRKLPFFGNEIVTAQESFDAMRRAFGRSDPRST